MIKLVVSTLLLAAYPLTIHLALLTDSPQALILAPIFFALGILWQPLLKGRWLAWLVLMGVVVSLLIIERIGFTQYLLFLPPVIFPALMLTLFAQSLLGNREAFITHIGEVSRGPLPLEMRRYTRRLTGIWCAVFILLMLEGLFLPFISGAKTWSWLTNIVNYLMVGGLFLGEFYWRKLRFPQHDHPNFIEYLHIIATTPPPNSGVLRRATP